ncbi:MAG: acyl-CoA dehydrogenase family protein [Deltaproteobacteria bacterium]|nr:acyl-CoA dehydrogenase family protein [Deltaproteobacteria bacterium]
MDDRPLTDVTDTTAPTQEHRLLRQMVRDLTQAEIEPQADEHDRLGKLNVGLLRRCGELGLLGITVPAEDGGAGMDALAAVIAHHEMSKSDPGFTLAHLAHSILFVNNFYRGSTPEQRRRYLAKVLSGEWIGGMGMTEPSGGTDVLGMQAKARRDGSRFLLTGRKTLITNGPEGDVFIVYAKVDDRITTFIVESGFPGFSKGQKIDKMGMRASTMCELVMDDCVVPAENVLGKVGGGLTNMMRNLEIERLALAAMSLGIADRCLDVMVRYSVDRMAFGKAIASFGQVQRYIADSYAMTEAARALIYGVARSLDQDRRNRLGSDAAKLFAAPVGKQVADAAMQVLGGWGYCTEYKIERFLRDAKLLEIGGGTLESHQKNITRELTGLRE